MSEITFTQLHLLHKITTWELKIYVRYSIREEDTQEERENKSLIGFESQCPSKIDLYYPSKNKNLLQMDGYRSKWSNKHAKWYKT